MGGIHPFEKRSPVMEVSTHLKEESNEKGKDTTGASTGVPYCQGKGISKH